VYIIIVLIREYPVGAPLAQRWIFALMGFLALVMAYGMRVSLSITITEMVKPINRSYVTLDDSCPIDETDASSNKTNNIGGTYEWNEYTQVNINAKS
jgi:ACS family sodium-dependent inorganic phosphate cotransporter